MQQARDILVEAIMIAEKETEVSVKNLLEQFKDNPGRRLVIIEEDYLPVIAGLAEALEKISRAGCQE